MDPIKTRVLNEHYKEYDKQFCVCPKCFKGMVWARKRRKNAKGSKTRTLVYFCDKCDARWPTMRSVIQLMVDLAILKTEKEKQHEVRGDQEQGNDPV